MRPSRTSWRPIRDVGCHTWVRNCLLMAAASGGIAAAPRTGLAQATKRVDFFVTAAVGGGSMGLSGLVSGSVQARHWFATLRTTGNLPPAGRPVATDLGLLVGYADTRPHVRFALSAGAALVETGDSSRTYGSPFNGHTLLGLPIQAEVFWRPARGIGFGAVGVGQLNARRSFWSLLWGLQLGRFE
jgi:hypothetical protein